MQNTAQNVIEFKEVYKIYGEGGNRTIALDGVSLAVEDGAFVTVLGDSGSGKSTALNIMGGLDSPSSGVVLFDGRQLDTADRLAMNAYRAQNIGFVFQRYNLISNLTAVENINLVKDVKGDCFDAYEMLKAVNLSDRADSFPSQLSGGEAQRVAIARAMAKKPRLLLCDEPTGALDYENGKKVLSVICELNKRYSVTVVMVTHNRPIAALSDDVIVFKSGKIIEIKHNAARLSPEEIDW